MWMRGYGEIMEILCELWIQRLFFVARQVVLAFCLVLSPTSVYAGKPIEFNIAPQSLESAIAAFMEQGDVDLLYSPQRVRGLRTGGVKGLKETEDALRILLEGTGINLEYHDGAYLLVDVEASSPRKEKLPSITVTATRTEKNLFEVPASVSVVDAVDIERQHLSKAEDALRTIPGLDLVYLAGSASSGIPILRGLGQSFAGTTTQTLLNGMPVEPLAITRRYLWYLLEPSSIERIEVVRGPTSVLYGPSAMGGVINIITKSGRGQPFAEASVGGGSHDGQSVVASLGGSSGDLDLFLSASGRKTDGYRPHTQTPPPSVAGYPASYHDLDGRDSESKILNGRLSWWFGENTELSLGGYRFENEGAMLGGHPNYRIEQEGTLFDGTLTLQPSADMILKGKFAYSDMSAPKRTYDEIFSGGDSLNLDSWDWEDEESLAFDLQLDLRPASNNTLILGATWWDGEFSSSEYDTQGTETWSGGNKSRTYGFFIQDEHRYERLTLTVGGRYDIYEHYDYESNGVGIEDDDDNVFTPRIAASYRLHDALALYASVGTAYIPAPNNLKYRVGAMWLNNPGLEPETSISYETGIKYHSSSSGLEASAALYRTRYQDKISVATVGEQRQFQNLGETRVYGVELDYRSHLGERWEPFFNYTYTDSEITRNPSDPSLLGNETANAPKHKANLGLCYQNPRLITAQVIGRYVGKRFFEDSNIDISEAKNHFITDIKLSKSFIFDSGQEWTASLALNNLFDRKAYGFWYELLDGRNYWVEVKARF
jgi:outer membrane receptor protein involved in Fe transport